MREELLALLVERGTITEEQADKVRDWSDENDNKETILGYVVGVGKQPIEVRDALAGTALAITTEEIKGASRPPSEFMEEVGVGLNWWKDRVVDFWKGMGEIKRIEFL